MTAIIAGLEKVAQASSYRRLLADVKDEEA
jgi:hypothetical protein